MKEILRVGTGVLSLWRGGVLLWTQYYLWHTLGPPSLASPAPLPTVLDHLRRVAGQLECPTGLGVLQEYLSPVQKGGQDQIL